MDKTKFQESGREFRDIEVVFLVGGKRLKIENWEIGCKIQFCSQLAMCSWISCSARVCSRRLDHEELYDVVSTITFFYSELGHISADCKWEPGDL